MYPNTNTPTLSEIAASREARWVQRQAEHAFLDITRKADEYHREARIAAADRRHKEARLANAKGDAYRDAAHLLQSRLDGR